MKPITEMTPELSKCTTWCSVMSPGNSKRFEIHTAEGISSVSQTISWWEGSSEWKLVQFESKECFTDKNTLFFPSIFHNFTNGQGSLFVFTFKLHPKINQNLLTLFFIPDPFCFFFLLWWFFFPVNENNLPFLLPATKYTTILQSSHVD